MAIIAVACTPPPPDGGGASPNLRPTAVIAASETAGTAPLEVTFDATGSTDVDGALVKYFWNFGGGAGALGEVVSHSFGPGTHSVELFVTDDDGASSRAAVSIEVTNDTPTATIQITPPTSLFRKYLIAAGPTNDANPVSFEWDLDAFYDWPDELFRDERSGVNLFSVDLDAGRYYIRLTVTDEFGARDTEIVKLVVPGAPEVVPTGLAKSGHGGAGLFAEWVDFSWDPVPGADSYEIEVTGSACGGTIRRTFTFDPIHIDTARVTDLFCRGQSYSAKIRAIANGEWTFWSPAISFVIVG